jgi:hypothetical protein
MPRQPIPWFMQADLRKGTENISHEDVAWPGDDADLDINAVESEAALRLTTLESVLLCLAAPHESGTSPVLRASAAAANLLGRNRKRGRKSSDDDELLRRIALEYRLMKFGIGKERSLTQIIRDTCEPELARLRTKESRTSMESRLRGKFRGINKDLLITNAAPPTAYEPRGVAIQKLTEAYSGDECTQIIGTRG